MQLTIFYDGFCPLCMIEMRKLHSLDEHKAIRFVDIQQPDFNERFPDLDHADLNTRIHARLSNGEVVTGLDATYEVWRAVGKGWVYAPLRWPIIRWFADHFYTFFARHRYRISYLLTGQKRCEKCIPLTIEQQNEIEKEVSDK